MGTPPAVRPQHRRRGEPWAIGSLLGYSSANIFDRHAVITADPLVGPFFRGLPSLLMGIFLVVKNRTADQMIPGSPAYLGRRALVPFVVAGALSTVGLFVYYQAMRIGGVMVTIPVMETYVIWGAVFARFILGERVRRPALLGLVLIAAGLAVLSLGLARGQPVSPQWYWAIPLALFTSLTYGLAGVLWRDGQLRGAHQSTAILLQFITSLAVAIAGLVVLGRFNLIWRTATPDAAALLASGVLSGVVGIYCLFTALRLMSVARVYAFSSLTPLVAAIFARVFLGEYLSLTILSGVLLVSVGVALAQIFRPHDERQV
jgi:drug/metabolite transporter (DMT)-like permease